MFENWKNFEGTYVNPIVLESRMTTIDEVRQFTRDKNPEADKKILEGVLARLEIVKVKYLLKDKKVYLGQVVVDRDLVNDIVELFNYIEDINNHAKEESEKFFIEKIIPISNKAYDGGDEKSMEDNNTSAHNYRNIKDANGNDTDRLSTHAFAFAIDINPKDNPLVKKGEQNQPKNGKYNPKNPNTLTSGVIKTPGQKIVDFLRSRGFEWGGDWKSFQDYQHFEKVIPTKEYIENYLKNVIPSFDFESKDEAKQEEIKISVKERIRRLIFNNVAMKYTDNLITLIADPQIKIILGDKDHANISLFLNKDLGNQF